MAETLTAKLLRAHTPGDSQAMDGEVRLRLSPPELGSLRLQVSVQDGVMVARMETETEAARSSLVNNLPLGLKEG